MRKATDAAALSAHAATSAAKTAADALKYTEGIGRETVAEMHAQTEAMQGASRAAAAQSEIARRSLDTAISSSELDQRAWMGVQMVSIQLSNFNFGEKIGTIHIYVKNYGKTPARIGPGQLLEWWSKAPAANLPLPPKPGAERYMIATAFPGITYDDAITRGFLMSSDDLAAFTANRVWIYAYGWIRYTDVFDRSHTTSFCEVSAGAAGFGACPDGLYPVYAR